ncbi:GTPase Der [Frankliniella fusca]|uniref:GTPase Der n=1 Tax=Frankliniella fusca TaxID=407009 RepID=A0AAE1LN11_9NEOP|nr:GTPase Der [Frankliniella fusca]KAK3925683.1 GTPase Der [Frankliniella fusca]
MRLFLLPCCSDRFGFPRQSSSGQMLSVIWCHVIELIHFNAFLYIKNKVVLWANAFDVSPISSTLSLETRVVYS